MRCNFFAVDVASLVFPKEKEACRVVNCCALVCARPKLLPVCSFLAPTHLSLQAAEEGKPLRAYGLAGVASRNEGQIGRQRYGEDCSGNEAFARKQRAFFFFFFWRQTVFSQSEHLRMCTCSRSILTRSIYIHGIYSSVYI